MSGLSSGIEHAARALNRALRKQQARADDADTRIGKRRE